MKKKEIPVLIDLAAIASYEGIQDDPIQMMTTGTLSHPEEDLYLLHYRESQPDEETGALQEFDVQLILKRDQVTMNRSGVFSNTMMFRKNHRYEGAYHTPYGDLSLAMLPREVRCELGEDAGRVHLKYELSMQGNYASSNELRLEYRIREN